MRTSKRRAAVSCFAVLLLFGYVLGQGGALVANAAGGGPSLTMGKVSDGSASTATTTAGATTTAASSLNVDLDQWANRPGQGWQNGDLNGNNSAYAEGLVVPFRLAIEGLAAGQHTIHLNYDFTAGGHEAYDFLATYNATENPGLCSSGGGAVSSMCPSLGGASTKTFPSDSFAPGSPTKAGLSVAGAQSFSGVGQLLTMYGGTIDAITGPTHSGPVGGNSSGDVVVTFTTSGSAALFAWGGHLAQSAYWKTTANNPNGAAMISGAPWHMRTQQLDNTSNKNQDRSIQPSAIVTVAPNVSVTKKADQATISAGDTAGFTITATNNGPGVAHNVTITDPLPSGINWSETPDVNACAISNGALSCTFGDLAEGASASVHVSGLTDAADCGTLTNTATVAASNEDAAGGGDNSASATIAVGCASIGITKTADERTVNAGQTIGFVITATNSGAGTASGVTVTDTLPADAGLAWTIDAANSSSGCSISGGVLTCAFGSIASGGSKHVHITSPTTAATCGTVDNTARVATSNDGSGEGGDSVTVSCPDLGVKKVADAATVSAGDEIGYTITVENNGTGKAFGVKMTDTLPANADLGWTIESATGGWSCSISSGVLSCGGPNFDLNAGASASVHITSPTTSATCGQVLNEASVSADNNLSVTTDQVTIVVGCASLIVTKVADDGTVDAGDAIGYTITVTNNGAGTARDATLSDTLPTNAGLGWSIDGGTGAAQCSIVAGVLSCSFGDLASGASKTVHISSPTTAETCGVVSNTVNAHTSNDGNPSAGPVTITVDCPGIDIEKVADAGTVDAGDRIGFSITVTNHGPGTAKDVVVSDTLPTNAGLNWSIDAGTGAQSCQIASGALSCSFGDMASGASFTVHIGSDTDAAGCGEVNNTATVTISNGAGDESSATVTVRCPLGVDIQKGGPDLAHVGDTIRYTFDVQLSTSETLFNVIVLDRNCNQGAPTYVSGDDGDAALEAGEVWHYTCTHVVTDSDKDPLPNTATVQGTAGDGRTTTDQDTHTVDLIHPAIRVLKSVTPISGEPGDTVTYLYKVKNVGDTTLYDISVDDDVIGHIGDIAELDAGDSVTLTKDWVLPSDVASVTNVGTATGTDVTGTSVSDDDDASVTIVEAIHNPKPPRPTAFTGSNALRLGLIAGLLLAVGLLALAIGRRRRDADA